MKGLSLLCVAIVMLTIMALPACSDTYVAGQVSGTWTLAGSPYMVVADIEIPYGLTLTIEPGVMVKFTSQYKFIAHGTLTAVGTASDSILFTHHLPYPNYTWKGLYLEGTTGTTELGYCIFEWGYAQGVVGQAEAKGGAVHAAATTVVIHDSRFSNNKASVKGAAIYLSGSAGEIYNCIIASNTCNGDGGGIYFDTATNPYVHGNLIINNNAVNGAGLHYVYTNGIFEENNVHNNVASGNGGGMLLDHSSPVIQENFLSANQASGSNGVGIYCNHYSNPTILYNEICFNNHGAIYCGDNCSPEIDNNTVYGNLGYIIYAYLNSNPFGRNNIMVGNNSAFYVSSGCSIYMTYSDIQVSWAGTGNLNNAAPAFVNPYANNFNLLPYSPCIDAGSPLAPLDPDGTIADMGAHYFDQLQPQGTCTITLTPFGAPIILPPQGGTVWYGVSIQNSPDYYNIFDGWINLQQPDLQIIPILLRGNIYLPAGSGLVRTLSLTLNAIAMPGTYTVTGYVGEHPTTIEDFDSFTFVKSASGDGQAGEAGTATISGWDETETVALRSAMPQETRLMGHSPEPFNPQTTISFSLAATEQVRLEVYDVAGRRVATLLNRTLSPGVYHEVFDGEALASGTYIYRLQAGAYAAVEKMVLMK